MHHAKSIAICSSTGAPLERPENGPEAEVVLLDDEIAQLLLSVEEEQIESTEPEEGIIPNHPNVVFFSESDNLKGCNKGSTKKVSDGSANTKEEPVQLFKVHISDYAKL